MVKQLWSYQCTYCYLPRLASYEVLEDTIRTGLNSPEYFAVAAAVTEEQFNDMKYDQHVEMIDQSCCLVKVVDARKQLDAEQVTQTVTLTARNDLSEPEFLAEGFIPMTTTGASGVAGHDASTTKAPTNTHFYLSARLDNTRINRYMQRIVEEVINHLTTLDGVDTEISLEVTVKSPNGVPPQIVRTVSENCRTLHVDNFGFDD